MRIWLDDIRPMQPGYDLHCINAHEALSHIRLGKCTAISFDHDLGEGPTGYDVACEIERLAFEGAICRIDWKIHSANPVGRANIIAAMKSAQRGWHMNGL